MPLLWKLSSDDDPNLAIHWFTLSFQGPGVEATFLSEVARSRWPVLLFLFSFDICCHVFRFAAKCWLEGATGGPTFLDSIIKDSAAQVANMVLFYLFMAMVNRRSLKLGSVAAQQEELLLASCVGLAVCNLLASLSPSNAMDYVYVAYFLICATTFLKIRWWLGTLILAAPMVLVNVWRHGRNLAALPRDAVVHIFVAWAVGALMAYLSDWARRQMFQSQKLVALAHEKEILEAQARMKAQRQLAAAQAQAAQRALKLAREKAANEAKSEFMSLMCHEVRTPLNGCLASAEMLLETALDVEQRELAKTIRVSGSILLSTVSNFLDFFKMEAGKQLDIVRTEVDLGALVADVHCIIEAMMGRVGDVALLEPQLLPSLPRYIMCDRDRVRGILLNLYTNAAKFTKSGHIGLKVREVAPDYKPTDITGCTSITITPGYPSALAAGSGLINNSQGQWKLTTAPLTSMTAPAALTTAVITPAAAATSNTLANARCSNDSTTSSWAATLEMHTWPSAPASYQQDSVRDGGRDHPEHLHQQWRRCSEPLGAGAGLAQRGGNAAGCPNVEGWLEAGMASQQRHLGSTGHLGGSIGTAGGTMLQQDSTAAGGAAARLHQEQSGRGGGEEAATPRCGGGSAASSSMQHGGDAGPSSSFGWDEADGATSGGGGGGSSSAPAGGGTLADSSSRSLPFDSEGTNIRGSGGLSGSSQDDCVIQVSPPTAVSAGHVSGTASFLPGCIYVTADGKVIDLARRKQEVGAGVAGSSVPLAPMSHQHIEDVEALMSASEMPVEPVSSFMAAEGLSVPSVPPSVPPMACGGTAVSDRWLLFEVIDTGVGIAPDGFKALFKDYVQGTEDEMRKPRSRGGTGLGLSICSKQVGVLGGRIGAYSQVGHGSAFWFTIPLLPSPANEGTLDSHPAICCDDIFQSVDNAGAKRFGGGAGFGLAAVPEGSGTSSFGAACGPVNWGCVDDGASDGRAAFSSDGVERFGESGVNDVASAGCGGGSSTPSGDNFVEPSLEGGDCVSSGRGHGPASAHKAGAIGEPQDMVMHPHAHSHGGCSPSTASGNDTMYEDGATVRSPAGGTMRTDIPECAPTIPKPTTCVPQQASFGAADGATSPKRQLLSTGLDGNSQNKPAHPQCSSSGGSTVPPAAVPPSRRFPGGYTPGRASCDGQQQQQRQQQMAALHRGSFDVRGPVVPPSTTLFRSVSHTSSLQSVGAAMTMSDATPHEDVKGTGGGGCGCGGGGALSPGSCSLLGASRPDYSSIKGRHVLLVEDNLINQTVARKMLTSLGLVCQVASNGLEAVQTIERCCKETAASAAAAAAIGTADATATAPVASPLPHVALDGTPASTKEIHAPTDRVVVAGGGVLAAAGDDVASKVSTVVDSDDMPSVSPAAVAAVAAGDADHLMPRSSSPGGTSSSVAAVLVSEGAVAAAAASGQPGAVTAAVASMFDVVLMDMAMPVMGGVDATRAIRKLGCEVPILAMTANASNRDMELCRAAGMNGFLSKPVLKDRLAESIMQVLQYRRGNWS